MKISIASIIGALCGFAMIIGAVISGTTNYIAFLSIEGFLIVIGGSLAVAFMSFQADTVIEALKAIGQMFMRPRATHETLRHDLVRIIELARIMKEKGLRGIEDEADGDVAARDPFIRYSLHIVASNYGSDDVRAMLETAADSAYERNILPARVLLGMASHAPAFGMVGTLVGMVIMLGNFSDDMSGVGHGLAISLLATLYGVVTARLLYIPAASKVMQKQDSLRFRDQLITEGMAMLVDNKGARHIQDRLNGFLRPDIHYDMDAVRLARLEEK